MRADSAPRTLRPVLPHQQQYPYEQPHPTPAAGLPDRWSQVPASKPESFGWFGRWSRRSRLAATVVIICSLAMVGALVISSAQAVKAVAGTNDQARYGSTVNYGSVPPDLRKP